MIGTYSSVEDSTCTRVLIRHSTKFPRVTTNCTPLITHRQSSMELPNS